jgi:hypothetical protein
MRMMLVIWQVSSHKPVSGDCPVTPKACSAHLYWGPNGKSIAAAHITRKSAPLWVLLLFFAEIITSLVVETNRYYHQFLDNSDDGPSPQHDVTEADMFAFLALTLQMGHTVPGRLEDYWTKMEQLCCPFYGQTMVRARYCHILRFLQLMRHLFVCLPYKQLKSRP